MYHIQNRWGIIVCDEVSDNSHWIHNYKYVVRQKPQHTKQPEKERDRERVRQRRDTLSSTQQ